MQVANLSSGRFEILHGIFEGLGTGIVARDLSENADTKDGWHVIHNSANKHCGRVVRRVLGHRVELLAQSHESCQIELRALDGLQVANASGVNIGRTGQVRWRACETG